MVIDDLEPYALCNVEDLEEFIMIYPIYEIVPLKISAPMVKV